MKLQASRLPPERVLWSPQDLSGWKLLVGRSAEGAVCRVSFAAQRTDRQILTEWAGKWPKTDFCRTGKEDRFSDSLVLMIGTAFQCAVWRALARIPRGALRTYRDIARQIGNPAAVRAVGGACGANPVPFFIPCHRVVAASGLGGFSAGPEVKRALLAAEGASLP